MRSNKPQALRQGEEDGLLVLLDAFEARVKVLARAEAAAVFEERQPAAAEDDRGITAKEAAALIGVSEWRVYELIKRGALPAYRPSPQRLRLRLGTVREFIRQKP